MKRKGFWKGFGVLTILLGLSLILMPRPGVAADPIPIGILLPYTGPLGWVAACQTGADIARDEINAAGGVLGRQIQFSSPMMRGRATPPLLERRS